MFHPPPLAGEGVQLSPIRLRALSLGAGVQSTTMALLAAHGEVGPMPSCAIFADTGWEPRAVYDHLEWLMSGNVLPFPVHIVSAGNIRDELLAAGEGNRRASIPAFAKTVTPAGAQVPVFDEDDDGELVEIGSRRTTTETVSIGMIRRQCTTDFKVVPIRRKVRELAGLTRKRSPAYPVVECWIGISTDEVIRAKPSFEAWQIKRFPLIEKRMSRQDCLTWLRRHGYPEPPKSSCVGCPFHDNARWRHMHDHDPEAWADAVEVDRALRTGLRGIRGEVFLHRSCVPLDQADLSTAADRGQLDLWPNECEGGCAVSDLAFRRVSFEPIDRSELNRCLREWGHRMGEIRHPTRGWSHGLRHGDELVAVVATDTLIRERVAGFRRCDAIELSRLCAARPGLCRVALRLWRVFVFPVLAQARGCRWGRFRDGAESYAKDLASDIRR